MNEEQQDGVQHGKKNNKKRTAYKASEKKEGKGKG